MNALKLGVGVDVSLTELVVLTRPGSRLLRRTYPNTLTGIRHLVRDLLRAAAAIRQEAGLDEDVMPVLVVAEATGNMHVRLENALFDADVPFSLVQPLKAKRYAQMKGGRSKSDRVDAEMLSGYALEIAPEPTMPPSRERQQIKQLVSTHRALVEESTRLTNQIHALKSHPEPNRDCLKAYSTLLASVQREKQRIDKAMNAALAASYGSEMRLLLSVKGIGPRTSTAFVAYGGDLSGFKSPRKLTAFIGLDPVRKQSGTSLDSSSGISKRGNRHVRTLLYMCAQTARKHNAACRALYERLIAAGKTRKLALIAVANKLVRQAWAVIHYQTPYVDGMGLSS